ncbi:helix-turn-helix domain-containing protein, partial [Lacticaseibacillus baoqingensis]
FRIEVVAAYLKGNGSVSVAKKFNIAKHDTVLLWVQRFQRFGVRGLYSRVIHSDYSSEFKVGVLNWMKQHQASYPETALHFDLSSPSTVWQWAKAYEREGAQGLTSKRKRAIPVVKHKTKKKVPAKAKITESEQEIKTLKDENIKLRIENEYLKKLDALARQKSQQAREQK